MFFSGAEAILYRSDKKRLVLGAAEEIEVSSELRNTLDR